MRKSLIALAASAAIAVAPISVFVAPGASAGPCDPAGGYTITPITQACQDCANARGVPACVGNGLPPSAAQAPPPKSSVTPEPPPVQAEPPVQEAQPHNGCFVASTTTTSNLLKECPNYTCDSILDEQMREGCKSTDPEGQRELLNEVGLLNPTGLYPMPRDAAGNPPTPPGTGPCLGSSMPTLCSALLGMALWVDKYFPKPPPTPDTAGGSTGIRG